MAASAQPVIQYANLVTIGYTSAIHMGSDAGTSDPTPNGANVTWDFSSATLVMNVGTMTWVDPATTPQGASYPASNLAQHITIPGQDMYNYYDLQTTQLDQLADGVGSSDVSIYADPKTILTFPMNYGDSYVDNFTDNGDPNSYTRTYSGYGTVILPTGTYTNVAKITSTSGSIAFLTTDPVAQLVNIDDDGNVLVFGDPVLGVAEQRAGPVLHAWPNPATDIVTVSGIQRPATWELLDPQGRRARQGAASPGQLHLHLGDLAPGCYELVLTDHAGRQCLRLVRS